MTTQINKPKEYHELCFTDDFMFCKILENNPDLCKKLIEIILNKKIKKIVYVQKQEVIDMTSDGKSIRLDVYCDDEDGTIYDLEMQTSNNRNLPCRTRYYQGMIDLNSISKGCDYDNLKDCFVIFLCTFDPFNKNLPVYTFTNRCSEMLELELGDNTSKVFLNPYGNQETLTEDMKALLDYMVGKKTNNDFINKIDKLVKRAIAHNEWRTEYMTLLMRDKEKKEEGRLEERKEIVLNMLLNDMTPHAISKCTKIPLEEVKKIQLEVVAQMQSKSC